MSTYEQLRGARLKFLDQDPANATDGQVWYNSTTGKDRVQGIGVGAFSSAAPMLNARSQAIGGIGTKDAAIAAGLSASDGTSEEYNGTGWSSGGTLNNPGSLGTGCGTLTAGSRFGGIQPTPAGKDSNYHENYDGTSWTAATGMPFDSYQNACGGTQTANIVVQSFFNPTPSTGGFPTATAEWDGSSWTAGGSINTARREAFSSKGGGTQTSTFLAGGNHPGGIKNSSETYDGTSWTSTPNINTARMRGGGGGTATAGIIVAGTTSDPQPPGLTTATESWDGSSWTTNPYSTAVAIYSQGSAFATSSSGVTFGGTDSTGTVATTEEFSISTTTVTPAAWSSGGNVNTARYAIAGTGSQSAALAIGGLTYPPAVRRAFTEEYDGTSWTEVADLNSARQAMSAAGTTTAAIVAGGSNPGLPASPSALAEEWDGSSWSEVNDLNTARASVIGTGTQTAALAFGGGTDTEEYDGTNWTTGGSLSTTMIGNGGAGIQTAALSFGGYRPPGIVLNDNTEEYNGTSWTTGGTLNTARRDILGGAGTQTNGLAFGGNTSTSAGTPNTNATEGYDGTSWSTRPSMATGRRSLASGQGQATADAAWGAAGYSTAQTNITEEFTGETTSPAPAQSLTTSS